MIKTIYLRFTLLCAMCFALQGAEAQNEGIAENAARTATAPNVLSVDATTASKLAALPVPRVRFNPATQRWERLPGDVEGVELNLSRADLQNAPGALQKLKAWAGEGGVILLHNDAAQLFDFVTQPARAAARNKGGQLFGFAQSALPLGALPLLDGITKQSPWGVREVWYQLAPGDHLAIRHPLGLPLLRVNDLAELQPPAVPVYAALLAPISRGWLLFEPRLLEGHRGDGALYQKNVTSFLTGMTPLRESPLAPCALPRALAGQLARLTLSASSPAAGVPVIANAGTGMANNASVDSGPIPPSTWASIETMLTQGLNGDIEPGSPNTMQAPFIAARGEVLAARATVRLLSSTTGDQSGKASVTLDETVQRRLRAMLGTQGMLWQVQNAWQGNSLKGAEEILANAEKRTPQSFETLWWRGILSAQAGLDIERPAPEAALWMSKANASWKQAATQPPLWSVLKQLSPQLTQ